MKRSLLARLRANGVYYIIAALLLLIVIPGYQLLLLNPQGYANVAAMQNAAHVAPYLAWINAHSFYFVLYRLFLVAAFLCIITLPFSLFRIIVAQEIIGRQEIEKEEGQGESSESTDEGEDEDEDEAENDLPPYAWRGRGFAVIAAWGGLISIIIYVLGTFASMLYFTFISHGPIPPTFDTFSSLFAILINTAGGGLLAISTLFFGAMITRSGLRLWPGIWLAFGYVALVVAILFSINAVTVATTPVSGQATTFTSPSILLFALWVLWLGIMLVRLKPEA